MENGEVKRGRGRPRKSVPEMKASMDNGEAKRGRGRPRKSVGAFGDALNLGSPPKRRSRLSGVSTTTTAKKGRLSIDCNDLRFSPSSLVKKLGDVDPEALGQGAAAAKVDLEDLGEAIGTDEYEKKREEVRLLAPDPENFDVNGRTVLSLDGAAIAGAKLVIDETRATRSMCKKLKEDCGIEEDEILYRPISYQGWQNAKCQELAENRKASVVESLVDFRKQIQFKSNVLQHVAEAGIKKGSKSDTRGVKKGKKPSDAELIRTPENKFEVNPLDGERIINNYALEVASSLRENVKRRRLAPIPFNIHLLDSDDES